MDTIEKELMREFELTEKALQENELSAQIKRLKEIVWLKEALRFYANPHNYGIGGGSSNNILRDAGKIAKGALK